MVLGRLLFLEGGIGAERTNVEESGGRMWDRGVAREHRRQGRRVINRW
jgi:hypothetical protein